MNNNTQVATKQKTSFFKSYQESQKVKDSVSRAISHIFLIALGIIMLLPFVWMISASLKPEVDIFKMPIEWIPETINWSNYKAVFNKDSFNFGLFYFNTLKIAVIVTIIQVTTCSLAGYAFSKIDFPGREKIFLCYLGTMMVPFQVTMIPLFIIMKNFGLINTHAGLILMAAFSTYGVFLLRQFYLTIPQELSEAAMIDGCGHFRIYTQIMLPNLKPALATLSVFTFLGQWNDFLAPFIFLNDKDKMTITLGLKTFVSEYNVEFGKIMAGTTIAIIPVLIVYLMAQKYFVEGIALSGVKG